MTREKKTEEEIVSQQIEDGRNIVKIIECIECVAQCDVWFSLNTLSKWVRDRFEEEISAFRNNQ